MSPNSGGSTDPSSPALPDDLADHLSRLDESELHAVISYAKSQLPPTPTVEELLVEREGEVILDVEEQKGYTKVVKTQPCAQGCDDCPHGPYLYHVRVEKYPENEKEASLHWEFIGPVQ